MNVLFFFFDLIVDSILTERGGGADRGFELREAVSVTTEKNDRGDKKIPQANKPVSDRIHVQKPSQTSILIIFYRCVRAFDA